jgi:hypothetical protein
MLTAAERRAESKARTGAEWELIAQNYARKGSETKDCCYACEAGRAYLRASEAYARANMPAAASAALAKAAAAYLECGNFCSEAGDLACASSGFAQAEMLFDRIKKEALAVGDAAAAAAAAASAARANQGVAAVERLQREIDRHARKEAAAKEAKSSRERLTPSPRIRVGAWLEGGAPGGCRVVRVIPGLPAHVAGLRVGDLITRFGGVDLAEASGFREILAAMASRKSLRVVVRRGARRVSLKMTPALTFYGDRDIVCEPVDDMRCNDQCSCERPRKGASCCQSYLYRGEGPNGGVLLLARCVAMTKTFEILDERECGIGEYI